MSLLNSVFGMLFTSFSCQKTDEVANLWYFSSLGDYICGFSTSNKDSLILFVTINIQIVIVYLWDFMWLYFSLKGHCLGSNLFSDKAPHKNKHLCKFSFLNDILFPSYVKVNFWWCLNTTLCRQRMNESLLSLFLLQQ